jgi:hypothetical protein
LARRNEEDLKKIHYFLIASEVIALGLLVTGFPKGAGLVFGLTTVGTVLISALTGKRSNEGVR